ncbi:MAG TPA: 30S ribosomal protein S6 [Armatimonadota bacterium]|jgi:small subunit ribosomal protein S6
MTRDYEILYIIDPDVSEETLTGLVQRFQQLAETQGAEIEKISRWDKRRLAYEVKGKREGIYIDMHLKAEITAITELERVLKITDGILRHLTVRKDEKQTTDYMPEPAPPAPEPRQEEPVAEAPTAPAVEAPVAAAEESAAPEAPETTAPDQTEEPPAASDGGTEEAS